MQDATAAHQAAAAALGDGGVMQVVSGMLAERGTCGSARSFSRLAARLVMVLGVDVLRTAVKDALQELLQGLKDGLRAVARAVRRVVLAVYARWLRPVLGALPAAAPPAALLPPPEDLELDVNITLSMWHGICTLRDEGAEALGLPAGWSASSGAAPGGLSLALSGGGGLASETLCGVSLQLGDLAFVTSSFVELKFQWSGDEEGAHGPRLRTLAAAEIVHDAGLAEVAHDASHKARDVVQSLADLIPFADFAEDFRRELEMHTDDTAWRVCEYSCTYQTSRHELVSHVARALVQQYPAVKKCCTAVAMLIALCEGRSTGANRLGRLLYDARGGARKPKFLGTPVAVDWEGWRQVCDFRHASDVPERMQGLRQANVVKRWLLSQLLQDSFAAYDPVLRAGCVRGRLYHGGQAGRSHRALLNQLATRLTLLDGTVAALRSGTRRADSDLHQCMYTVVLECGEAGGGDAKDKGEGKQQQPPASVEKGIEAAGKAAAGGRWVALPSPRTVAVMGDGTATRRTCKTVDTLFLKADDRARLLSSMRMFEDEGLHAKLGLQRKLCLLVHGPPGTGKSATIEAVASYLGRNVYSVCLADVRSNDELRRVFEFVCSRKGLLALEDFDTAPGVRRRDYRGDGGGGGDRESFTLDCMLNLLQGPDTPHEAVVVATTNHPEALDPALTRAMRFDCTLHLTACDRGQLADVFRAYVGRDADPAVLARVPDGSVTPAVATMHMRHLLPSLRAPAGAEPPDDARLLAWAL